MPKIDFYVLKDESAQATYQFACKLIDKAYRMQQQLDVLTPNPQSLQRLDDLLWSFNEASFVPHEIYTPGHINSPVLISCSFDLRTPSPGNQSVLVNLSEHVPSYFDRYQRITEVVAGADIQKQQARTKFQFYRDNGYKPTSHNIN